MTDTPESNRDRVRRVLIEPLGFRFPRGTEEDAQRKALDALADELAHMSETDLQVLAAILRPRGQGKDRNLWPDRATIRAFAHEVRPRPLDHEPALLRWFGSVEGPRAIAEGTLVETAQYFARNLAPPVTEGARRVIRAKAEEAARRLRIVEERRATGRPVDPQEAEWARWYRGQAAYWGEVVAIERERRGAA